MTRATLFQPVFSAILHDRRLSSFISGVALLQLLLTLTRFPSWPCPVFHTLGIPCPGCGMSLATLLLRYRAYQAFSGQGTAARYSGANLRPLYSYLGLDERGSTGH